MLVEYINKMNNVIVIHRVDVCIFIHLSAQSFRISRNEEK